MRSDGRCACRSASSVNRRNVCAGLLLTSIPPAWAVDQEGGGAGRSYHLLPESFKVSDLRVQSPPDDDLVEAELVMGMQSLRTESRLAEITAQNLNPVTLFWQRAGLDATAFPAHARWVVESVADTEAVLLDLKRRFGRRRPNAVLATIRPVIPVPWHASYPSGHATQAVVIARLLATLAPASTGDLMEFAFRVGHNREVAGVHYPSDTSAGFSLGWQLGAVFLERAPAQP